MPGTLPGKSDNFLVFGGQRAGRRIVPVIPHVLTKLLVCAVCHLRETLFQNAGAKKIPQIW
jgi:hypothetical protein